MGRAAMDLTLAGLLTMARDTVSAPREGARRVLALGLSVRTAWIALALMAVGSALLTHLSYMLSPPPTQDFFAQAMSSPFRTAVLQGGVMAAGAWAMFAAGAARGGRGSLAGAISLLAWLQFILLVLQVAQLAAQVILPPLAGLIGFAGVVLFFWLLTSFVMELHGFRQALPTFLGIVAVLFMLGLVAATILSVVMGVPGAA